MPPPEGAWGRSSSRFPRHRGNRGRRFPRELRQELPATQVLTSAPGGRADNEYNLRDSGPVVHRRRLGCRRQGNLRRALHRIDGPAPGTGRSRPSAATGRGTDNRGLICCCKWDARRPVPCGSAGPRCPRPSHGRQCYGRDFRIAPVDADVARVA